MFSTHNIDELREKAEELLKQLERKPISKLQASDIKSLLQELQIHQIELELQNEELLKTQEALETERAQLRDLFDYAPSGYIILSKQGTIKKSNQAFCMMLGLPKSEIIDKNINTFLANQSKDTLYLHLMAILENEVTESCQIELKSASISDVWVKIESKAFYSADDKEYLIRSSLTDISKNIKLSRELNSEKKFVDKILENAGRLIITIDKDGKILQFNKAAEKLSGIASHTIIGKHYWELPALEKDQQQTSRFFFNQLNTVELPYTFEEEWKSKEGQKHTIRWEFSAATNGGKLEHVIGIGENVTESNKKEEHILRLSKAVEQSANSIVITDLDGNIEYANPRFYEVTKYTPQEVIGKNPRIVKYEHSKIDYKELWDTISSGKIWKGEFLNKTKYGKHFWELATISPVRNSRGDIINYLAIKEDITYRKKTEEQILKAKNFYLNLLEDFPVMVWRSNPAGRFDFFNQTWLNFTGRNIEMEYTKCAFRNIHPDEKFIFSDAFSHSLKNKTPFIIEYRLKDRYGNYRWMLSHGRPFNDMDGNYGGFIGTCVDIHDRYIAEQRLMLSEDNYRRMFEDSSLGIFKLDKNFSFVSANKAFAQMFGYESPVDFLMNLNNKPEKFFKDLIKEKEFRKNLVRSEKNRFVLEREFFRKDKNEIHVVIHLRKVNRRSPDKEFYLEGFVEDVTKRKNAEKNLKNSEQKFKALFEKSYDAVLILDQDRITDCNQKAAKLFKIPCKELRKLLITDISPELQASGKTSKELALDKINLAIEDKPQTFDWLHLREARLFDAEVSLAKVIVNDKPRVQAIIRDVSEKKLAEKNLKKAKEEAEKARTVQSEFLSLMSHEIRTPLNAVISLTDLMLQEEVTDYHRENLDSVKISARHLLGLINDILDYNKIESGNIQFEETEFDLIQLINDLKRTLLPKCSEKGIALKIETAEDVPHILKTDTLRLKQILYNLLSNAIKFTEKGSVKLRVFVKSEFTGDNRIFFEVEDTGIGISNDRLEAIFEKFTQAEVSTSRKYGGSGLGLTITKKLIELQEGEITAESEVNKGSSFTFYIPMQLGDETEFKKLGIPTSEGTPNIEGMKILMAEDDLMNQFVAKRLIEAKWKANLTIVSDGEKALEKLKKNQYELILMDLLMPGIDGYQTTQIIRKNEANEFLNPSIPIIALTADAFMETRQKAYAAGVDDFITKPFDYKNLLDKISRYAKA